MKKILLSSSVIALLVLPAFALATGAYNDVTLGSSAVVSVNGITVNVTGATLNQIAVGATSFDVTLGPGSTISLSVPGLNQLAFSTITGFLTANQCDGSGSTATLTAAASAATTTITVTPSTSVCANSVSPSGGSGGGGNGAPASSGGGGGGGVNVTVPGTTVSSPTTSGNSTIEQLKAQLNALLAQLAALQGLPGNTAGNASAGNASQNAAFNRTLKVGSTGADVKALQAYLNTHGFVVAATGPGSPGNETTVFGRATKAALQKLQKSAGITPVSGIFGPLTTAYIAAHP